MKKNENVSGLLNVFKALEDVELSEGQLNDELSKIGIPSDALVKAVHQKIEKLKTGKPLKLSSSRAEFDPFLLAAGSKKKLNKKTRLSGKLKKRL